MKWSQIVVVAGLSVLCACQPTPDSIYRQPIFGGIPVSQTQAPQKQASSKMALLLPLTGKSSAVGLEMRQAAMMALFDHKKDNAAIVFYDTQGTKDGAIKAYEQASAIQPSLIIGPVFSAETKAVRNEGVDVPVLSFTSDNKSLGDDVYTLALMIPNQIERIVEYACQQGQRKLAVLGPENRVGELTMNTLDDIIDRCPGMTMQHVSLYDPKTVNFDPVITKIVPPLIDPKKPDLTEEEIVLLNTPMADRLEFDSLLIFEDGVQLQQIISLLSYYDVDPSVVPIYGLSSWSTVRDKALIGSYYPAMPTHLYQNFSYRFRKIFGKKPSRLAAYAYDAVSLGSLIGKNPTISDVVLTNPQGFKGVNGRFQLKSDGTNKRLLDMMQIKTRSRAVVVEQAPQQMPQDPDAYFVDPALIIETPVLPLPEQTIEMPTAVTSPVNQPTTTFPTSTIR